MNKVENIVFKKMLKMQKNAKIGREGESGSREFEREKKYQTYH